MFSGLLSHLVPHSPSSSQPSRGTTPRMAVLIKAIGTQSLNSHLGQQRGGRVVGGGVHSNDLEPRLSTFIITLSQELFQRPLCGGRFP